MKKDKHSISFKIEVAELTKVIEEKAEAAGYSVDLKDEKVIVSQTLSPLAKKEGLKKKWDSLTPQEREALLEKYLWIRFQDDIRKEMKAHLEISETAGLTRVESKNLKALLEKSPEAKAEYEAMIAKYAEVKKEEVKKEEVKEVGVKEAEVAK